MNRRDFLRFLAVTAAGTAALPEQINAFEQLYRANTPLLTGDSIFAADEFLLSGVATSSQPLVFELIKHGECWTRGALNLFGGIMLWRGSPMHTCVGSDIGWKMYDPAKPALMLSEGWLQNHFVGHISYLDQDGVRHMRTIESAMGRI